jgi:hypothetical protein
MRATLRDGTIIEGTVEQVQTIIAKIDGKFDPNQWYHSDSKGWVQISTMDAQWLRNALLKMYREWVANLSNDRDFHSLVRSLRNGPNDPTFTALLAAYIRKGNQ